MSDTFFPAFESLDGSSSPEGRVDKAPKVLSTALASVIKEFAACTVVKPPKPSSPKRKRQTSSKDKIPKFRLSPNASFFYHKKPKKCVSSPVTAYTRPAKERKLSTKSDKSSSDTKNQEVSNKVVDQGRPVEPEKVEDKVKHVEAADKHVPASNPEGTHPLPAAVDKLRPGFFGNFTSMLPHDTAGFRERQREIQSTWDQYRNFNPDGSSGNPGTFIRHRQFGALIGNQVPSNTTPSIVFGQPVTGAIRNAPPVRFNLPGNTIPERNLFVQPPMQSAINITRDVISPGLLNNNSVTDVNQDITNTNLSVKVTSTSDTAEKTEQTDENKESKKQDEFKSKDDSVTKRKKPKKSGNDKKVCKFLSGKMAPKKQGRVCKKKHKLRPLTPVHKILKQVECLDRKEKIVIVKEGKGQPSALEQLLAKDIEETKRLIRIQQFQVYLTRKLMRTRRLRQVVDRSVRNARILANLRRSSQTTDPAIPNRQNLQSVPHAGTHSDMNQSVTSVGQPSHVDDDLGNTSSLKMDQIGCDDITGHEETASVHTLDELPVPSSSQKTLTITKDAKGAAVIELKTCGTLPNPEDINKIVTGISVPQDKNASVSVTLGTMIDTSSPKKLLSPVREQQDSFNSSSGSILEKSAKVSPVKKTVRRKPTPSYDEDFDYEDYQDDDENDDEEYTVKKKKTTKHNKGHVAKKSTAKVSGHPGKKRNKKKTATKVGKCCMYITLLMNCANI